MMQLTKDRSSAQRFILLHRGVIYAQWNLRQRAFPRVWASSQESAPQNSLWLAYFETEECSREKSVSVVRYRVRRFVAGNGLWKLGQSNLDADGPVYDHDGGVRNGPRGGHFNNARSAAAGSSPGRVVWM
jgi:hypothetical protein